MDELKKCPFCGSKVVYEERNSVVVRGRIGHIYCPDRRCGADFWFYECETDKAEMIKRFNRRESNE